MREKGGASSHVVLVTSFSNRTTAINKAGKINFKAFNLLKPRDVYNSY